MVFWVVTRRRVVNNYHKTPCNYPEEHRFHQHRGGCLKSNSGSCFLRTQSMSLDVHHSLHKSPPIFPTLKKLNAAHDLPYYFKMILLLQSSSVFPHTCYTTYLSPLLSHTTGSSRASAVRLHAYRCLYL